MAQQGATARYDASRLLSGKHRYDVGTPREDLRTYDLNDDISDLFGPGLADGPGLPYVRPGTRFVQPAAILEMAAAREAADKAERKEAAAERRREKSAALKAAKLADKAIAPKPVRKPRAKKVPVEGDIKAPRKTRAKKMPTAKPAPAPVTVHEPVAIETAPVPAAQRRIVSGSSIPKYVTGIARITGTVNAKTGEAIVVEVEGQDMTARGIMVWAGKVQTLVRGAIDRNAPVTLLVTQPANDRFKPSAPWGKAA